MRIRQDVLSEAPTWGGVRVGEQTGDVGESALEFTLPGENLDIALGALDQIDARVVSTEIDVDARQIERTTTTTVGEGTDRTRAAAPDAGQVRLRVEVAEQPADGLGSLLRALMAVFSVIGVVATFRWVGGLRSRARSSSTVERLDLREDPPTQETPRVPPSW